VNVIPISNVNERVLSIAMIRVVILK